MKNRRILYFSLLILILSLSISSANALDDVSNGSLNSLDYVNSDNSIESLDNFASDEGNRLDAEMIDLETSEGFSNYPLEKDSYQLKSSSQNSSVLKDDAKTFTDLENLISSSSSSSIDLSYDYVYSSGDDKEGILIDRDIEINGNNHKLNALSLSRIFNVTKGHCLSLNDLNIINANSGFNGGAIYSEGNVIASNCTFKDNTILNGSYIHYFSEYDFHNGGAVFINSSSSSQSKFINCRFINNLGENGGAIYSCSNLIIENCSFSSNTALGGLDYDLSCYGENTYVGGEGAAIYCLADCNIISSEFSRNLADLTEAKGPGVVYLHSKSIIQDSNFTNNNADDVVYWLADGIIKDSLFLNNSAHDCGGAIFLAGNATVSGCDFIENYGSNYGGAIYSIGHYNYDVHQDTYSYDDSSISISDCNFLNNSAYFDGGALYLIANTTVENCNFSDNYVDVEKFKEINPYYYYWDLSTAGKGGAVYMENGTISSSSFQNNNATLYGGAIYSNGTVSIQGSDFKDNDALKGDNIYNIKSLELIGNNMDSQSPSIYNDNFYNDGIITSLCTLTILDNKTYYFKSIGKLTIFASLCDDMDNMIEDYKIILDLDSFDQDVLFNNQTGLYEYDLTNIFENGTMLIGGAYSGSSNLTVKTATLNIGLIPTQTKINIDDIDFGQDLIINISLSADDESLLNETVDVAIKDENNETIYTNQVKTIDGQYNLIVSDLNALNYTAFVAFNGSDDYSESSDCLNFTVNRLMPVLIIDVDDIQLGDTAKIDISLLALNDYVDVFITSLDNRSVKLDKGKGEISLSNLSAGTYTVIVSYNGSQYCDAVWNFTEFRVIETDPIDNGTDDNSTDDTNASNETVKLIDTSLTIDVKDYIYGDNIKITIKLADNESNPLSGSIRLNLNNEVYDINVIDGDGSIELENLSCDTYGLYAKFDGDDKHNPSSAFSNFKVNRLATAIEYEDMNTTAVNVNVDGRIGKYFSVSLKDSNGNPLSDKLVKIGFNGKVYNKTTNSEGIAKLQINLAKEGTYTFAIAFLGEDNYNSSFVVSKITVSKQTPKLSTSSKSYAVNAKSKTLTATLLSSKNNPISGKVLTFTVNGKTYSAKTNSKGIATVKVSLSTKKTYSFTVKFAGNGMYAAVSKSAKLTIK